MALGVPTSITFPKTGGSVFGQQASSGTGDGQQGTSQGWKSPWKIPGQVWSIVQQYMNPATPLNDGMSAVANAAQAEAEARAYYGPESAALDLQRNIIQRNLARSGSPRQGPDYRGHDLDLQMLDKELAQLGIDREAAARQPGLIEAIFGIDTRQHQGDLNWFNQMRGFADQARGRNERAARSDATARGAVTSAGHAEAQNDILNQYQQDLAGIGNEERTNVNQFGKTELNYKENKASAADRIKTLDIEAEKYGIKREQLENAFQRGIQALGIQNQIDTEGLADMLASNDIQKQMLARQIADMALRAAG